MQNQKESKIQRNPKPHSLVQNPKNRMEEGRANKYSHMPNPRNATTKGNRNLIKKKHVFTQNPRDQKQMGNSKHCTNTH